VGPNPDKRAMLQSRDLYFHVLRVWFVVFTIVRKVGIAQEFRSREEQTVIYDGPLIYPGQSVAKLTACANFCNAYREAMRVESTPSAVIPCGGAQC
jgi:hypothetical protein